MSSLSRADLRAIHDHLERSGVHPLISERIRGILANTAGVRSHGKLVLSLSLPLSLAPSLNAHAGMMTFQRVKARKEIDNRILVAAQDYGGLTKLKATKKRAVVVTRFTTQRMDELSTDACGGKMPIDRLVQAGLLTGDTPDDLQREARQEKCKPGTSRVVVDVFELNHE